MGGGLLLLGIAILIGILLDKPRSDDTVGFVAGLLCWLLVAFLIPSLAGGIGLQRKKRWARFLIILLGKVQEEARRENRSARMRAMVRALVLDVIAVKAQADAAQKEQRRKEGRDDRLNRERQRHLAIAAREVAKHRGEQHAEQSAAYLTFSFLDRRLGRQRNLRQSLTAEWALEQPVKNVSSTEWALARCHGCSSNSAPG